jgi:hypothetical protein
MKNMLWFSALVAVLSVSAFGCADTPEEEADDQSGRLSGEKSVEQSKDPIELADLIGKYEGGWFHGGTTTPVGTCALTIEATPLHVTFKLETKYTGSNEVDTSLSLKWSRLMLGSQFEKNTKWYEGRRASHAGVDFTRKEFVRVSVTTSLSSIMIQSTARGVFTTDIVNAECVHLKKL